VTEFSLRIGFAVLTALAITVAFALAAWEYFGRPRPWSERARQNLKVSLSAIGPNVATFLLVAPWWAIVYFQAADYAQRNIEVTLLSLTGAFIACDFSYYIEHRCGHKIRLLWRLHHGAHHHSDLYNIPLAYRVSFLTQFTSPIFYIPWLLLGFHPLLIVGFQVVVLHYQAWIHTELIGQLGILDRWFNTPAIHRMHHSKDPAHKDVNLGGVLMIWDHLFGSYCAPEEEVSYGVAGVPATTSFAGVYLDPWKRR
jgi:sterol desaturase/sphingolipid hydroxylase (fatty acid hydroxylase superfamily)